MHEKHTSICWVQYPNRTNKRVFLRPTFCWKLSFSAFQISTVQHIFLVIEMESIWKYLSIEHSRMNRYQNAFSITNAVYTVEQNLGQTQGEKDLDAI